MNPKRVHQISEEVRRGISEIIQRLKDPRIPEIISVSRADVTNDLSFAKVYISFFNGNVDDVMEGLNSSKGYIKRELSKIVKMRVMPELIFIYDDSIEKGLAMDQLIREVNRGSSDN
ncbi:30S ribosome-binding factor RbfA [Peptoniphilus equinus]|uniref:Ribosome-binding factor A n=1 Tax=Peptoniphilus equinus TaxID=3016343 RepID=A0ABY7QV70_9FIRM|nr:30S ribosome-binding factor RbfA [Peptoniphilus equinus]WBW50679.1 30S ribosome-binding factor RbfA [Peptoniphilus equinus]